jgi:hypothetical protein
MNRLQKFAVWLENVFWYHYKWYWMLGVAVLTFAALSVYGNITEIHYDWKVAVYNTNWVDEKLFDVSSAENYLTEILPDYDGNGKTQAEFVPIAESTDIAGDEPLFAAFFDSDIYAVISDKETLTEWQSRGFVTSLHSVPNSGLFVALCDNPPAKTDAELARANGYSDVEIAAMDAAIAAQHDEKYSLIAEALDK